MLFEPDKGRQTEYIKNSYRHGEYTEFYVGKERAGYKADENGLTLWSGSYLNRTAEASVSWETVRDSIAFYMEKGEYLKEGQIPQWEALPPWRRQERNTSCPPLFSCQKNSLKPFCVQEADGIITEAVFMPSTSKARHRRKWRSS